MRADLIAEALALAALCAGAATDLRRRIVPNALTFPAMGAGVLVGLADGTAAWRLKSLGICLAAGFLLWALGAVAEGDAKLFAAAGSLLGADAAFLGLALACALLLLAAVPLRLRRAGLRRWLAEERAALLFVLSGGRLRHDDAPPDAPRLPFAPFLLPGTAAALALLKTGVV